MYIAGINIKNYKSFKESGKIPFTKGFNVIVGANNVGKTALLEALSWTAKNNPHKNLDLTTTLNQSLDSKAHIRIGLSDNEIFELHRNSTILGIPHPLNLTRPQLEDFTHRVETTLKGEFQLEVELGFANKQYTGHGYIIHENLKELDGFQTSGFMSFNIRPDKTISYLSSGSSGRTDFANDLAREFSYHIYLFNAERLKLAQSRITGNSNLSSDASNLAGLLHRLNNRDRFAFDNIVEAVQMIFPDIRFIDTPMVDNTNPPTETYIRLWSIDYKTRRDDLAFSLAESGTGVGQVLAMLYVVLTTSQPLTLLIDEPQSFLHPAAIRKLFEIFKQYPQHQYIVTTHSPTVIAAADPDNILLVTKEDSESKVQQIKKEEKEDMERILYSVGASLSDVFGADNILWVEGPTEEKCFPLILRELKNRSLFGTVIQNVVNTGDFAQKKKRNIDLIKQIYDRLSKSVALMPPAIGFIFDNEGLNQVEIDDLTRYFKDKNGVERLALIPRKMYENYLLNADAIAHVLSQELKTTINTQQVQEWLADNQRGNIETLDGAKLFKNLFLTLSNSKLEYDKIRHGYQLTQWLINNNQIDDLQQLADFLDNQVEIWMNKQQN